MMREQDPRFMNLEKKVGVFFLVAFLGLACVVVFVGLQQDLFVRTVRVSFIADSGKDIREGQSVEFRGFKIGKVKGVLLNEEGKVEVNLAVYQEHMKWIREGSKARLVKDMLIGDAILDILPGDAGRPEVTEGGRILFEREKGLGEVVADLQDDISPAIEDVKRLAKYLQDPEGDLRIALGTLRDIARYVDDSEGDLKRAFRDFRLLAKELPETRAQALKILTDVSRELEDVAGEIRDMTTMMREGVVPAVGEAVSNVDRAAARAHEALVLFNEDLPARLDHLDRVLAHLEQITEDLKKSSPHWTDLTLEIEGTARETRKTLEAVQGVWFLRSEPEFPRQRVLKMDSDG